MSPVQKRKVASVTPILDAGEKESGWMLFLLEENGQQFFYHGWADKGWSATIHYEMSNGAGTIDLNKWLAGDDNIQWPPYDCK